MSLVGVLPVKVTFVELVELNVMSTSPWIACGFVEVKPETFSVTSIILHLPSSDVGLGSIVSDFLHESSVKPSIIKIKIACFIISCLCYGQFYKSECCKRPPPNAPGLVPAVKLKFFPGRPQKKIFFFLGARPTRCRLAANRC